MRREEEIAAGLAQFQADQRAEEEEIRAAIAAVEEAERQLRKEREAEEARHESEARELTIREFERLQNIISSICVECWIGFVCSRASH